MAEFTTEFVYNSDVKLQLDLPLKIDVEELVHTLILNNHLPVFKDRGT